MGRVLPPMLPVLPERPSTLPWETFRPGPGGDRGGVFEDQAKPGPSEINHAHPAALVVPKVTRDHSAAFRGDRRDRPSRRYEQRLNPRVDVDSGVPRLPALGNPSRSGRPDQLRIAALPLGRGRPGHRSLLIGRDRDLLTDLPQPVNPVLIGKEVVEIDDVLRLRSEKL